MTTQDDLTTAFQGESMARNKYRKWGGVAKKEGHQAIAKIFEETAENEYEHASMIMKLMQGFIGNTSENLKKALDGENYEWQEMYKTFAENARAEGNEKAAKYFEHVMHAEKYHARRFANLLKMLESDSLYKSDKEEYWFCTNCGYIEKGFEAPNECPNCLHPQGYFIRKSLLEYGEDL